MDIPKNKAFENLIDTKHGRLIVLEYYGCKWPTKRTKGHLWKCLCKCGNETVVLGSGLKSGGTQSCGCYQKERVRSRIIDLTGNEYGRLLVESYHIKKGKQIYWLCKCECGNKTIVAGNSLKSGKSKSCGCRQGNFTHGLSGKPGYKKYLLNDPIRKIRHAIGGSIRTALKSVGSSKKGRSAFNFLPYTAKELKFHLEALWEPWMNWDNYGGRNDNPELTWHIDHIKPQCDFYYTSMDDSAFAECWALDNLRPLEKIANLRRGAKQKRK